MARRAAPVAAVPEEPRYPDGWFTALVRRHNWPPRFEPQFEGVSAGERARAEAGARGREVSVRTGAGWGTGGMVMPGTPGTLPPGTMGAPKRVAV